MKKSRTGVALLHVAAISCGLQVSCVREGSSTGVPPAIDSPVVPVVTTISVSATTASLEVGSTLQLAAIARDASGNVLSRTFTWSSSDTVAAKVGADGVVAGVTGGRSVVVSAAADGVVGRTTLAVDIPSAAPDEVTTPIVLAIPSGVALTPADLRLAAGVHSAQLTPLGSGSANMPRQGAGLVTAVTAQGDPVLMALVVSAGAATTLSVGSTAEALAFLNGALASSNSDTASRVLAAIRSSPLLPALQAVLDARMRNNARTTLSAADSNVTLAVERIVDDVVSRIGSPRSLHSIAVHQGVPLPEGSTSQGGVHLALSGIDSQGRSIISMTNTAGRWISVVASYSQDGQTFTTSASENGPFYWPRTNLSPLELSLGGLAERSANISISPSAAYVRVKAFGLGFQDPLIAFQDADADYVWAPAVATFVSSLVLPSLEVISGVPGLAKTIGAENRSAWVKWFSDSGACTVTKLGGAVAARATINIAMRDRQLLPIASEISVCAFQGFSQQDVWRPILTPVLGRALASSVVQYLFAPLKLAILGWTVGKNATNLVLTAHAISSYSTLYTFRLRDDALAAVSRVDVAPTSTSLTIGASIQMLATPREARGVELTGRALTWTSSNPSAVTVSQTGLISCIAGATQPVLISATAGGITGSAIVTVVASPSTPLSFYAVGSVGSDTTSALYRITPTANGTDVRLGTIRTPNGASPAILDVAQAADGRLFALGYTGLYRLAVSGTVVTATQLSNWGVRSDLNALAFDPGGNLVALGSTGGIWSISTQTGTRSQIGSFGSNRSSAGDLVFVSSDEVLAVDGGPVNGGINRLMRLQPSMGWRATDVSPNAILDDHNVWGLRLESNVLYGVTAPLDAATGFLIAIDQRLGTARVIRPLSFRGYGAAIRMSSR